MAGADRFTIGQLSGSSSCATALALKVLELAVDFWIVKLLTSAIGEAFTD